MNTLPEWYTVEAEQKYLVEGLESQVKMTAGGKRLSEGIRIRLEPGQQKRLLVRPAL